MEAVSVHSGPECHTEDTGHNHLVGQGGATEGLKAGGNGARQVGREKHSFRSKL